MIICPNCKEEIDDNSYYCDQCGQALVYCSNCARVGLGRRCTHCGGIMVNVDQIKNDVISANVSSVSISHPLNYGVETTGSRMSISLSNMSHQIPSLTLINTSLNICISGIIGAVIGRRQGPYKQYFEQNLYVSGVHAQLEYNKTSGWCIVDKNSSNGTKLNQHILKPDELMTLKNGDIITIANINLEVIIKS